MSRIFLFGSVLATCLWTMTALVAPGRADEQDAKKDNPKKEQKDDSKKNEGPKRSQTTRAGTVKGTIKAIDETSLTLEVQVGSAKQKVEGVLIATDVKVRVPAEPEFDSKGKLKPFKPDPSDPDRKLGGVKGSKDDLKEGQPAVVTLGKLPNKKLVATVVVVLPEKK
jgi:hypothetical protein